MSRFSILRVCILKLGHVTHAVLGEEVFTE